MNEEGRLRPLACLSPYRLISPLLWAMCAAIADTHGRTGGTATGSPRCTYPPLNISIGTTVLGVTHFVHTATAGGCNKRAAQSRRNVVVKLQTQTSMGMDWSFDGSDCADVSVTA